MTTLSLARNVCQRARRVSLLSFVGPTTSLDLCVRAGERAARGTNAAVLGAINT